MKNSMPTEKDIVCTVQNLIVDLNNKYIKSQRVLIADKDGVKNLCNILNELLDLINRQQTEIERLEGLCKAKDFVIDEMLKQNINNSIEQEAVSLTLTNNVFRAVELHIDTIKAETIKECLGKIEQMDVSESDDYIMVKKYKFDNLVKEMVGEDE